MKIEKNTMVSLVYELRENDTEGKVIESLDDKRPLNFIFGTGRLLPEFESNLSPLSTGDNFSFALNSENAYGERREEMIIDLPMSVFEKDGKVDEEICRVGNEVPMMDSEGHPLTGLICEIAEKSVKMDFNHPMAGINLYFTGKILDVRNATEDEIAGLNHSCSGCGSHEKEAGCSSCAS
jgi:FKBP-type peptidyl-prolyl cis-trans isomerase SlyD